MPNYQAGYLDGFNFLAKFPSGREACGPRGRVLEEVAENREGRLGPIARTVSLTEAVREVPIP